MSHNRTPLTWLIRFNEEVRIKGGHFIIRADSGRILTDEQRHPLLQKFHDEQEKACPCCGHQPLKYLYPLFTAQSGRLDYYKCKLCKEKLVSVEGQELDIAAP